MIREAFSTHSGVAAPMLRSNIDTDAIIPSREMQRVSREGLGQGLFAAQRYIDRGEASERLNPDFVLNQAEYAGASILLAGANMGCGSSREFAVWALVDFGIRVIIAPSFGTIFHTNCVRNGLLPVVLDTSELNTLAGLVKLNPQEQRVSVNLSEQVVIDPAGRKLNFKVDPLHKKMLLNGLDSIDIALESRESIDEFESSMRRRRPWIHLG